MLVGSVMRRSGLAAAPVRPPAMDHAVRPRLGIGASITIGLLLVFGFTLRLLATRNDLWLDEIWSIDLVATLPSADGVFWRIAHDNNHYLNSLWLYALGPDRSPTLYRLPAVVFGSLSVLVAARIGLRRDVVTGIAAAALVSTSCLLINYGSEARGYSGLILALLVAIHAFEEAVETAAGQRPGSARIGKPHWILGTAIGIGALFHLTMLAALPVFAAAAVLCWREAGASWRAILGALPALLLPCLIMVLPAIACVLAGSIARDGFEIGGRSPFSWHSVLTGFGTTLRLTCGLPAAVPLWLVCGLCGIGLALACRASLRPTGRWLTLCGTVALPCVLAAAHLPNLEFPRYFLIPGVIFMLALAETVGTLWRRGSRASRGAALAMLSGIVLGQIDGVRSLILLGRGSPSAAADLMLSVDRPVFSSDARFQTQTVIDFYASRRNAAIPYAGLANFCVERPQWYIDTTRASANLPPQIDLGPPTCRASFEKAAVYPTSLLSGMTWTLYRRAAP